MMRYQICHQDVEQLSGRDDEGRQGRTQEAQSETTPAEPARRRIPLMAFQQITSRDKPETLARKEAKHAEQLKRALAIAVSRARRSDKTIRALLDSATVQGKVEGQTIKAGIISFSALPFRGGLHQFWPWQLLTQITDQEIASVVASALRSEVRRKTRKTNSVAR